MILNILVNECWKCKNDYLVAYLTDDSIPIGPSYFSEKQIEIAKENNVRIEMVHSKTMDTVYNACICPHCNAFLGEFFYHDFAYIDGDIQIFLNEKDNIIETRNNNAIILREHNGYSSEFDRQKLKGEIKNNEKDILRQKMNSDFFEFSCVRVKFENGKNYLYNCPFEINVGDIVYVEGKLQGVKGTVLKIEGKWRKNRNMMQVIKVEKDVTKNVDC